MRSDWFFLVLRAYYFLTDNSLQSTKKTNKKAVLWQMHDAVVKFDTYRNLQLHRAGLPAIAQLLFHHVIVLRAWRGSVKF